MFKRERIKSDFDQEPKSDLNRGAAEERGEYEEIFDNNSESYQKLMSEGSLDGFNEKQKALMVLEEAKNRNREIYLQESVSSKGSVGRLGKFFGIEPVVNEEDVASMKERYQKSIQDYLLMKYEGLSDEDLEVRVRQEGKMEKMNFLSERDGLEIEELGAGSATFNKLKRNLTPVSRKMMEIMVGEKKEGVEQRGEVVLGKLDEILFRIDRKKESASDLSQDYLGAIKKFAVTAGVGMTSLFMTSGSSVAGLKQAGIAMALSGAAAIYMEYKNRRGSESADEEMDLDESYKKEMTAESQKAEREEDQIEKERNEKRNAIGVFRRDMFSGDSKLFQENKDSVPGNTGNKLVDEFYGQAISMYPGLEAMEGEDILNWSKRVSVEIYEIKKGNELEKMEKKERLEKRAEAISKKLNKISFDIEDRSSIKLGKEWGDMKQNMIAGWIGFGAAAWMTSNESVAQVLDSMATGDWTRPLVSMAVGSVCAYYFAKFKSSVEGSHRGEKTMYQSSNVRGEGSKVRGSKIVVHGNVINIG
ncbi:hypothetical protein ACFL16_01045 [Patescibacteria group bacterium]